MLNFLFLVIPFLANLNKEKWRRISICVAIAVAAGVVGVRLSGFDAPVFLLAAFEGEVYPRVIWRALELDAPLLLAFLASLLITFVNGVKVKVEYLRFALFPLVSLSLEPAFIVCYLLMSESLRVKPSFVRGTTGILALVAFGVGHIMEGATFHPLFLWLLFSLYLILLMGIALKPVDKKENFPALDLWLASYLVYSVLLRIESGSLVLVAGIGAILASLLLLQNNNYLSVLLSMLLIALSLLFFHQPMASSLHVVIASMLLVVIAEAATTSSSKRAAPCASVESYLGIRLGLFAFIFCLLQLLRDVHLELMAAGAIVALLAYKSLRSAAFYLANNGTVLQGGALRVSSALLLGSFIINWLGLL